MPSVKGPDIFLDSPSNDLPAKAHMNIMNKSVHNHMDNLGIKYNSESYSYL